MRSVGLASCEASVGVRAQVGAPPGSCLERAALRKTEVQSGARRLNVERAEQLDDFPPHRDDFFLIFWHDAL